MTHLSLKTDSLAHGLHGAARAIADVRAGTALPQALARLFAQPEMTPQARGAIQDLAYLSMRRLGLADGLLALLANKPPQQEVLHGLLTCALSLLLDEDHPAYDAFTVVNQAVEAAAADAEMSHAKGVVNAILRRFLRERATLLPQVEKTPPGAWNYPTWWIDRLKGAYPAQWQDILRAGNAAPPLTLRVNRRKSNAPDYLHLLALNGIGARQVGADAVRLDKPLPVSQIPGFADGLVSVQDAAAQMAAPLLDVQDGMRVLDACAAPGGKTGHLLECADLDLVALDHDPKRLRRIEENLQRLQLKAQLLAGDARNSQDWWDGEQFDRILADVPCTASGIVRRHPDIRWLRRKNDTAQLTTLSAQILDNLWQMLKPGGKLLLVTCSLWPQESEEQAAAFAKRHQDNQEGNHAVRLPAPGQLLPTASAETDHDGLFYALFQKTGP